MTQPTFGQSERAVDRNSSSGPEYSCDASLTNSTASAIGSAPIVIVECVDPKPPTPGVSTSTSPPASNGDGTPTSTDSMRRTFSGFAASVTYCATSSNGTASTVDGVPSGASSGGLTVA